MVGVFFQRVRPYFALLFVCGLVSGALVLIVPGFSPEPPPVDAVDSQQKTLFEECLAARDRQIHHEVFSTVDNPDVQRELLATRKERAVKDCRQQYPQKLVKPSPAK